jgi:glycolate oxidase FAD binding subunit
VECVRLELGRIREHVEVDPDEGIATFDAGVRIGELARRLAACGKTSLLAERPPEGTAGGALAADPFVPDWTLDRRLPNEVLGVEIALANGELAFAGGRVVKNVTGFDLVRLYCGSLGTLGVITRATVRLRAAPACERVVCARFPSLEAGIRAFACAAVSSEPAAAALRPDGAGAELICRLTGAAKAVELQAARFPGETAKLERWTQVRAELATPPAAGRARVRLSARPSDVEALCRGVTEAAGAAALRSVYPLAGSVIAEVEDSAIAGLFAVAERLDALLCAERAPGAGPAPCDVFGPPPSSLALMRAVKLRFDPRRVLAPGRFIGGI